jgi:hypothetical protein
MDAIQVLPDRLYYPSHIGSGRMVLSTAESAQSSYKFKNGWLLERIAKRHLLNSTETGGLFTQLIKVCC